MEHRDFVTEVRGIKDVEGLLDNCTILLDVQVRIFFCLGGGYLTSLHIIILAMQSTIQQLQNTLSDHMTPVSSSGKESRDIKFDFQGCLVK